MLATEPISATANDAAFLVQTNGTLHPWMRREWLLTNGLGAFSSSTVVGCNMRRYHGLLVAATTPPVGRMMALNRIGETIILDGDRNRPHELGVNQFQGAVHPRGERYLKSFRLWEAAHWEYEVDGVSINKTLLLCWKKNLVGICYELKSNRPRPVRLELSPFTALRDFHSSRHATGVNFHFTVGESGPPHVVVAEGANRVNLMVDHGTFEPAPDWWYGQVYPIEGERGLDDTEDLYTPGRFVSESGDGNLRVVFWASVDLHVALPSWEEEIARARKARGSFALPGGKFTSTAVKRLIRAADDFLVDRVAPDGSPGTTVIAGYPWFADWGRDTFISLPGLMLTTGKFEEARKVLTVFGHYVDGGMIPNRFDDYTNEPHYNTVDAAGRRDGRQL